MNFINSEFYKQDTFFLFQKWKSLQTVGLCCLPVMQNIQSVFMQTNTGGFLLKVRFFWTDSESNKISTFP